MESYTGTNPDEDSNLRLIKAGSTKWRSHFEQRRIATLTPQGRGPEARVILPGAPVQQVELPKSGRK